LAIELRLRVLGVRVPGGPSRGAVAALRSTL
jgi:hypothetical protein